MDYRERDFMALRGVAPDLAGASVLVVGCGRGLDCELFVRAGADVAGIDICDDIGADFPDARYLRSSVEDIQIVSDSFDVVYTLATMEHVHGIDRAFAEMVRVAKPGGLIYSFAAPLWFSRNGHHMECLEPYPWIHLRMRPAEIAEFAAARGILHDGQPVAQNMDFLFCSPYFNRLPVCAYTRVTEQLPVSTVIQNYVWRDEQDPSAYPELARYPVADLVARSHLFIARK
jgi:SAM-dependent methyltransferase